VYHVAMDEKNLVTVLKNGGIAVIPTDTIYGVVASAFHKDAVERIYQVKKRDTTKACIVLIGDFSDLQLFDIRLNTWQKKFIEQHWPGPLSIIIDMPDERFSYLHRGNQSIAFRLPEDNELRTLVHQAGPLIAPSANPEGAMPAETIEQAQKYFGDTVDYYKDEGQRIGEPSTLVKLNTENYVLLRKGVYAIS
jgi:L-threonylcarbamoyladenylate synthase